MLQGLQLGNFEGISVCAKEAPPQGQLSYDGTGQRL